MAIILANQYTNTTPASTAYPQGSGKNETSTGLLDGTPMEKAWFDDIQGFLQASLEAAGVVPSGSADTVLAPQYLSAIANLRYYNRVEYKVGTVAVGSDGKEYVCQVNNGPATVQVDPVSESPRTYWFTREAVTFLQNNPVGEVKQSVNNPHGYPAGTWDLTSIGRFPVGVNTDDDTWDTPGGTGGAKTHVHASGSLTGGSHVHDGSTLTTENHTHEVQPSGWTTTLTGNAQLGTIKFNEAGDSAQVGTTSRESAGSGALAVSGDTGAASPSVSGDTASGSSLPPYQAFYFWQRTA